MVSGNKNVQRLSMTLDANVDSYIQNMKRASRETSESIKSSQNSIRSMNKGLEDAMLAIINTMNKSANESIKVFSQLEKVTKSSMSNIEKSSQLAVKNTDKLSSNMSKINKRLQTDANNYARAAGKLEALESSNYDKQKKRLSDSKNGLDQLSNANETYTTRSERNAKRTETSASDTIRAMDKMLEGHSNTINKSVNNYSKALDGFDKSFNRFDRKVDRSLNRFERGVDRSSRAMLRGRRSLIGSINDIEGQIVKMQNKTRSISAGSILKFDIITRSFQKLTSTISSTTSTAVNRIDTMNNAMRSFQNIGFNNDEIEKAMNTIETGIKGLPTALDEAVNYTQQLALGTKDAVKAAEAFNAINDAIIGFGGSRDDVTRSVENLNKALQKGKIDGTAWNSMITNNMGPALDGVAARFGITTSELQKSLSDGSISTQEFLDELIKLDKEGGGSLESLQKIARDSTDGIQTSMANAKTAIARGNAEVIKSFDDLLRTTTGLNIAGVISETGSIIENVLKSIAGNIRLLEPIFSGIFGKMQSIIAFAKDVSPVIKDILSLIIKYISDASTALSKSLNSLPFSEFSDNLKSLNPEQAAKGTGLLVAAFVQLKAVSSFNNLGLQAKMSDVFSQSMVSATNSVIGFNSTFSDSFQNIAGVSQKTANVVSSNINSMIDISSQASSKMSKVLSNALSKTDLKLPVSRFISSMSESMRPFVKFGAESIKSMNTMITKSLNTTFNVITRSVNTFNRIIMISFKMFSNTITSVIMKSFKTITPTLLFGSLIVAFGTAPLLLGDAFVDGLIDAMSNIVKSADSVLDDIASYLLPRFEELGYNGSLMIAKGLNSINEFIPSILGNLGDLIKSIAKAFSDNYNIIASSLKPIIFSLGSFILDLFSNIDDGLFKYGSDILTKFIGSIANNIRPMALAIVDAFSNILSIVSKNTAPMMNFILDIFIGAVEVLGDNAYKITNSIIDILNNIKKSITDFLNDSMKMESLSTSIGSILENINKVMAEFIKSIIDIMVTIVRSTGFSNVASEILRGLLDMIIIVMTGTSRFLNEVIVPAADFITQAILSIVDVLVNNSPAIIDAFSNVIIEIIKSLGNTSENNILQGIGRMIMSITLAITRIAEELADTLPDMLDNAMDTMFEGGSGNNPVSKFLKAFTDMLFAIGQLILSITPQIVRFLLNFIVEIFIRLLEILSNPSFYKNLVVAIGKLIFDIVKEVIKFVMGSLLGGIPVIGKFFSFGSGRKKGRRELHNPSAGGLDQSSNISPRDGGVIESAQNVIRDMYNVDNNVLTPSFELSTFKANGLDNDNSKKEINNVINPYYESKVTVHNEIVGDTIKTTVNQLNSNESSINKLKL